MTTAPQAAGEPPVAGVGRPRWPALHGPGAPASTAASVSTSAPSVPGAPSAPATSAGTFAGTSSGTSAGTSSGTTAGTEPPAPRTDPLTRLLGAATLGLDATRRDRVRGWLGPLLVTALAAVLRFANLDRPPTLVFDETHYVKHAWTLLRVGYEARWPEDPNAAFVAGDVDTFLPTADYAVHPQVGKWLIALGMHVAGPNPFGWRLAAALAGTLSVLLLARIARRLFDSTALGTLAGGLLAVDGQAIVHSRTGLLDGFLMLFVLGAFGALLVDRDHARRRLAGLVAEDRDEGRDGGGGDGRPPSRLGPRLGPRPWRLAAGVLLGLAVGTKWSGLYFLAVLGVLTVAWDVAARRAAGVPRWAAGGLLRDGVAAFVALVPVAAVTYVATWFSWFRTPQAYQRQWAATHPGEGVTWLPESVRSWWRYHQDMWGFHTTLTSEHPYAAHPLGWLVQWRPTAFYYESPVPARAMCGADRCSSAITALGNPVLWWLACVALVAAVWWLVRHRDWRAAAVLSGLVAGWLPWLGYAHRTIFAFYSIAFTPWMVLAVVWALHRLLHAPGRRQLAITVRVAVAVLVAVVSAFFYPLWTAQTVAFRFWQLQIWLPGWV